MKKFIKKINKLAIGSAQFGMKYGVANNIGKIDKDSIKSILDYAFSEGVDTIDTAKSYGSSEKELGLYLKDNNHNFKIITKINNEELSLKKQLLDSIEKLNTTPHALLAHKSTLFFNNDFYNSLLKLQQKYDMLKIGLSIYNIVELEKVLLLKNHPDIVQIPMSILDTRIYKSGILKKLYEAGIEIHVRSIFLQGLFFLDDKSIKIKFPGTLAYINQLKNIASKSNLKLHELSLLWVCSLKEVRKIIIGVDDILHLKNNVRSLKKNINEKVFNEALSINFDNEKILNPSLWV